MKETFRATVNAMEDDLDADVLKVAYSSCCDGALTKTQVKSMKSYLESEPVAVGLEQNIISSCVSDKRQRRGKLLELVCNLHHDHPNLSRDDLSERLRQKCKDISRPARIYALSIGQAQATS